MPDDEEELGDVDEPDDPDIVELEALEDDDLIDDDDDDGLDDDVLVVDDLLVVDDPIIVPVAVVVAEEDDDDDDDDDDLDPDDVEAGLDVILKDRLVVVDEQDDEDDDVPDADDRAEGSTKVVPKRPGEFVCQSCFLVKHPSQLADPERMFCRDCV